MAAIGKDRIVTVSFDRDATTPDVQSYYLYRKGPGDKDFTAIAQTPQLNTGARINVFDDRAQYKGGDYLYQVETHRNGASGDGTTTVVSDKAKSQSNKVTMSDPPPGVTAPPTTTPKGGGPPPVVRGTPSGVTRSSGFSGSSSGSSSGTTPTSEAVTPDPGFVRGLPYAAGSPSPDNGNEGDNSAVAVTPGRHGSSGKGWLVPVAGSAVFILGALHLRIFKKRLDEPPTTLTPIS